MAVYKNQGSRLCCGRAQLLVFEHKYDYILLEGERLLEGLHPRGLAYKALSAMLNRLWTYKDAYMLFICDYKVPYTNDRGTERGILKKTGSAFSPGVR